MATTRVKVCKDCPDRFTDLETGTTCHSSCEKYISEKEQLDKYNEQQRQEKNKVMDFVGYERDKALRLCDAESMRKRHKKGDKK